MGVQDNHEVLSAEHLRNVLFYWFQDKRTSAVQFIENTKPENEPYADYFIAYEAVFETSALDKARIEVWATTDGAIAIGLETKIRIAERLGIKRGKQKIFAAGHEPSQITEEGLLALLTLVAGGRIAISASCLPGLGFMRSEAVLLSDADEFLASRGYDARWWLKIVDDFEPGAFSKILRFLPW